MSTLSFSTHFRRPNLFRFEWRHEDRPGLNVIWGDGENAFAKYFYETRANHVGTVVGAIGEAARASDHIAQSILPLLIEQIKVRKLTDLKDLAYRGTKAINGEECHHLEGTSKSLDIFISKTRSVFLKIDSDYTIPAWNVGKLVRSNMFKSFVEFRFCLFYLLEFGLGPEVDARVRTSTVYESVLLNSNVPTEFFTEDGPGETTI